MLNNAVKYQQSTTLPGGNNMNTPERIMVVDDEKGICQNVEKILSKNNYEVICALSAAEALERLKTESFDLMISDIVMPGMNGLELLKQVKTGWPKTRALMMTAYASTDTALKAIRLGALDYVSKPFTPDELRTVVRKAMAGDLVQARASEKEIEVINVIDIDIPFDGDEVAKYTGEDYVKTLGRSDMPVIEVRIPDKLENFCAIGDMVCDIFKKLGGTCKAGNKSRLCPQKTGKKSAASPKMAEAPDRSKWIGIDLPFNYDEVVSVTGPEYVAHLGSNGVSFVPYEELKKNVGRMMGKPSGNIDVDMPFDRSEVAKAAGDAYADMLGPSDMPVVEVKISKKDNVVAAAGRRALVIDDEVAVNNNIRKILEKKGYRVDQAISRQEALKKINESSYPVIMLDLKMPGVKGLELLQSIRERRPEAMVVIITGYASIETAVETARMGAVGYLSKPFTPDEIRGAADNAARLAA